MTFDFKSATNKELKEEYKRIADEMGDDQFFTKKELNYLPEALQPGEQVLAFSSGIMEGNTWLIVLTDRRVIFLDKGMIYGLTQKSISLQQVSSVTSNTGIFFGKISIAEGTQEHNITNVWKKTVKVFTNKCQDAIHAVGERQYQSSQPQQKVDPYQELEKVASLKDKGVISEEEFEVEKKKILG